MKKLLVVVALLVAQTAFAESSKLDLMLRPLVEEHEPSEAFLGKTLSGDVALKLVDVLIKSTDPDLTRDAILSEGGRVGTIVHHILTASVPTYTLADIADRDEVVFIEASKRLTSKLDTSRVATGASQAQDRSATGSSLTGRDVIVGVVDDALDYGHSDFSGRIQFVRARNSDGTYAVCIKSEVEDGTCASAKIADQGQGRVHGTHVTGIAASADDTYKGMAPDADIFFVFSSAATPETDNATDVTTFSGAVLDGVEQIFLGADLLDKPAVVNLSLGTSLGAHDDTSLLEQGLNDMVGDPGRVIVNAAGNENVNPLEVGEGAGGIHADVQVSSGTPEGWRFGIISTSVSSFGGTIVDIWLNRGDACTVEARAYRTTVASSTASAAATVGPTSIASDASASDNTDDDGTVRLTLSVDASDTNNSRPHIQVDVTKLSSASWSNIVTDGETADGYVFDVIVRATTGTCTGSMWLYPDYTTINDFLQNVDGTIITGTNSYTLSDGDSNKSATIPSTASGVISVGSYMQEKPVGSGTSVWTDINGTSHDQTDFDDQGTGGTVGEVSNFSSLGPTGEVTSSRTKPDVVAPGEPVISTLARGGSVLSSTKADASHVKLDGTSMSSPHVTGLVALLLQYNNTLTASQVKQLLEDSATPIAGADDNAQGSGIVNIAAALSRTSADTSAYSGTGDVTSDDVDDDGFVSGGGGGSSGGWGCRSTLVPTTPLVGLINLIFFVVPIGLLVFWRRFSLKATT